MRANTPIPMTFAQLLVRQLSSPVRWTATVGGTQRRRMHGTIVECGPGGVLAGLVKRIDARRRDRRLRARIPGNFHGRDHRGRSLNGTTTCFRTTSRWSPALRAESDRPSRKALAGAGAKVIGTATSRGGRRRHHFVAWKQRPRRGARRRQRGLDRRAVRRSRCARRDADHPGEQCRDHARHVAAAHEARRLGRGDRHQSHQRVSPVEGRASSA